jgi:hypothetical protein
MQPILRNSVLSGGTTGQKGFQSIRPAFRRARSRGFNGEAIRDLQEESPPRRDFVGVNKYLGRLRFEVASVVIY